MTFLLKKISPSLGHRFSATSADRCFHYILLCHKESHFHKLCTGRGTLRVSSSSAADLLPVPLSQLLVPNRNVPVSFEVSQSELHPRQTKANTVQIKGLGAASFSLINLAQNRSSWNLYRLHHKPFSLMMWSSSSSSSSSLSQGWLSGSRETVRAMASSADSGLPGKNRLSLEKSPYLLQHANNPVDWYPWGEEAFKKAKEENKPIFLSVGYSTCHWCHVMERESFENSEIGQLLNEHFVSIKVDREERPDVDRVYMTFVQATSGAGGWPMTVWLTPDLKPILGGTYFPPEDRYYNRAGLKTLLGIIAKQWKENQAKIETQGTKAVDALILGAHVTDGNTKRIPSLQPSILKCFKMYEKTFDEEDGGFGNAPKFPQPVVFNMLFRYFQNDPNSETGVRALQMCLHTLSKMAKGGIHDHISHGFHRYSTDKTWHVPHFEKMLYDQGQLAASYMDAYQITKDDIYVDAALGIYEYVNRDLSHPAGGFYSAEDADSLPTPDAEVKKEGAFCVWEYEELQKYLGEPVAGKFDVKLVDLFCYYYGVKAEGNVDPLQDPHEELKGQNVLKISSSFEDTAAKFELPVPDAIEHLEKCKKILYEVRQKRPRPHLDNKMVSGWNGLMISGFARGGQVLEDSALTNRAEKAATFLREHMFDAQSGILLRSCYTTADNLDVTQIDNPIRGFLDDYVFVIRGLLDLYETCHDDQWLAWAEQLQLKQNELFWDEEGGAYFTTEAGDNSMVVRIKEDQDGSEPGANSMAAMNLLRLSALLGIQKYHLMGERIFRVFSERIDNIPVAFPEMVASLMFYHCTPKQIIIFGDKDSKDTKLLVSTVHSIYLPNKVLIVTDGQSDEFLKERQSLLPNLKKIDGKATAFVCENFKCTAPVNSCDKLLKQLESRPS